MKKLTVWISRFDPEKDETAHLESYTVNVNEGARVPPCAPRDSRYTRSVPLVPPLLCIRPVRQLCSPCQRRTGTCLHRGGKRRYHDRAINLPVKKDLVVDLLPTLEAIAFLQPIEHAVLPKKSEIDAMKPLKDCIECLACVSVCPAMDVTKFLGPTAMRQEMRLALDPRDKGERIADAVRDGLFTCTSCQTCWKVCPKNIEIPGKSIEKLREQANKRGFTLPRHLEVAAMVKATGRSVTREKPHVP